MSTQEPGNQFVGNDLFPLQPTRVVTKHKRWRLLDFEHASSPYQIGDVQVLGDVILQEGYRYARFRWGMQDQGALHVGAVSDFTGSPGASNLISYSGKKRIGSFMRDTPLGDYYMYGMMDKIYPQSGVEFPPDYWLGYWDFPVLGGMQCCFDIKSLDICPLDHNNVTVDIVGYRRFGEPPLLKTVVLDADTPVTVELNFFGVWKFHLVHGLPGHPAPVLHPGSTSGLTEVVLGINNILVRD